MAWSACDGASPCRLVTAGEAIDVWEPAVGRRIRLADQTNAQAVDITADGDTVVSAGWGSTVAVWTLGLPVDDAGRSELTPAGQLTSHDAVTGATARLVGPDVVEVTASDDPVRISTGTVAAIRLLNGATRLLVEGDGVLRLFDTGDGAEIRLAAACQGAQRIGEALPSLSAVLPQLIRGEVSGMKRSEATYPLTPQGLCGRPARSANGLQPTG